MKKANRFLALIMILVMTASFATGCGGNAPASEPPAQSAPAQPAAEAPKAEAPPAETAPAAEAAGPVAITAVRPAAADTTFPEGDSLENNIWTRLYKSDLGIDLQYTWIAPDDAQYDQKLNISITSGDLPDIFRVNANQLKQLVDEGMLADLTDVYASTADPYTKEVMMQDGGNAMMSATFDGRLMAIPKMDSGIGNSNVLWIRTDWLQALGKEEPKTMEDLLALARAFTTEDPDKNGQNDTYGLALNKDLWGAFASLEGFFNGFGAYPNMWVETGGALQSGNIQPEMKNALKALQDLYRDGGISMEFGVKDSYTLSQEDVSRGKVGIAYGLFWNMGWLGDAKAANPDMEWKPYAIVGEAGRQVLAQVPFPITIYHVVNADCANPEALVKMLNLQLDKSFGANAEPDVYNVDMEGRPIFSYPLIYSEPPMKNLDAQTVVTAALASGDASALNAEQKGYYDQIAAYRDGTAENMATCWGIEKMYGPEGSLAILNGYMKNNTVYNNRYYGPSTETMTQTGSILLQNQLQVFTEIIMGGDIGKFDQYAADWKALGGDTITGEVNAWFAAQ